MPLLLCPNDNASMQTVSRNGVEFDMCPTCRGVWLDRGELEKLMQASRDDAGPGPGPAAYPQSAPPPRQAPPQQYGYGERGEHGERGEYGERGHYDQHGRPRRKRGFDLFDIFD
ncbi:zf-TFIIB domain-containing protein [Brevundimonas sp.]|uniref:TFIIB-type zinc ribbon-containing protein n=1 Tax=Brevundimonas sp. TaxID=1871086 RepID=UPI0025CDD632|nr:zf-TFIIB domain-containing protein [Brevundimonas sp.]